MSLRPAALLCALILLAPLPARPDELDAARVGAVREHIKKSWATLTRSNKDLPAAAVDPKFKRAPNERWPVYLSPREDRAKVEAALRAVLSPAELAKIELRTLPADRAAIKDHGLLYLPHPYVVPGGRFNEMYGWDSYFIQVGLLGDGELERARHMAENFIYEIDHYGTILNANRTYYLSRSQPPFLTTMVLGVYRQSKDRDWLRRALPAIDRYYTFWTTEPHLVPGTGLSRYYDLGDGPAPEVLSDEKDDHGRTHYDRIRTFFKEHPDAAKGDYDVAKFYDRAKDELTPAFYKGDRSMRESGFDPSNRFGLFNVDVTSYAPVCLNSLLYKMELEAAEIHEELGDAARGKEWRSRAASRREAIDRYLWDDEAALYLDYNFETKRRRFYPFATTFYPLWVGAASDTQARRVRENLGMFEAPGGVLTSPRATGNQWDAPFGWAPLQMIPVAGLRRYGFQEDADRLARKFLSLVAKEYGEHNNIVEKYDLERRESDVKDGIRFGYTYNVVGFGWTNAAFVEMLGALGSRAERPPSPPSP
jgi:alpha,alpha-trehalase